MASILRTIVLGITITMTLLDTFKCPQKSKSQSTNQPTLGVVLNPKPEGQNRIPIALAVATPRPSLQSSPNQYMTDNNSPGSSYSSEDYSSESSSLSEEYPASRTNSPSNDPASRTNSPSNDPASRTNSPSNDPASRTSSSSDDSLSEITTYYRSMVENSSSSREASSSGSKQKIGGVKFKEPTRFDKKSKNVTFNEPTRYDKNGKNKKK